MVWRMERGMLVRGDSEGGKEKGTRTECRTDLVATNLLGYIVESLYYTQTQLLPLLIFIDDDIFDVPHHA